MIKEKLNVKENDGFLVIALPKSKYDIVPEQIISRVKQARIGVPAETRLATQDGETVFLRPRPGPSRMYPETDIPPVTVTQKELQTSQENIPKPWDEIISNLKENYQLNTQLAEQIFDSEYLDLFEKICSDKKISPNFTASILCSTITNLQRKGLNVELLKKEMISQSFKMLAEDKITKESLEIIFENIMNEKSNSVEDAIKISSISSMSDDDLSDHLDVIIGNSEKIIEKQGERAIGPIMGMAMKELRGKASGEKINQLLVEKIQKKLSNKN